MGFYMIAYVSFSVVGVILKILNNVCGHFKLYSS